MGYWERRDEEKARGGVDLNTLALAAVAMLAATLALFLLRPPGSAQPLSLEAPSDVRVVDGDTLDFAGLDATLRIRGIDTPESGGRAGCSAERRASVAATAYAEELVARADSVRPVLGREIERDRWGRYLGDAELSEGSSTYSFADAMLASGHARRWDYDSGQRRPEWC